MRIAIVFPHLPLREEERTTYERSIRERYISKKLNEEGHESYLCYLTHETSSFTLGAGPEEAHFFPIEENTRRRARKFYTSGSLGRALADFQPDLVIFKGMGYILPWWLFRKRFIGDKIAFIAGGNPDDILLPIASYVYSEYESQLTGKYSKLASKGFASILGKYVPDADFNQNGNKEFDIVSVGSISRLKNHRALVSMFGKYSILIVGDGPELPELKKSAEGLDHITITGEVSKESVSKFIQKARLMVHPSRFEGFPRVFAESFSVGVPVIALKRAIRGEFPENYAGLLVEEPKLVEQVNTLLADNDKLKEFSRNAFTLAESSYRGEIIINQILQGLIPATVSNTKSGLLLMRFLLLPLRQILWTFDHYLYQFGRPVKKFLKKIFRR